MAQLALKPQDVVVLLKRLLVGSTPATIAGMALDLGISASEVHAGLRRLRAAGLLRPDGEVNRSAAEEFLVHAVKYAFPPQRGELTRGVVTAVAAPPLNAHIAPGSDPPPVWPHLDGTTRGATLEPLYRAVPGAALRDPALHALLALVDAIRAGRARERRLAEEALRQRLHEVTDARPEPGAARPRRRPARAAGQ